MNSINTLGYIGLGITIVNYTLLNIYHRPKVLYFFNSIVGFIFTIQSFMLGILPLILFHAYTGGSSLYNFIRKNPPYICYRDYCERRMEK